MSNTVRCFILILACLTPRLALSAQDVYLRAGTLLQCTLQEPNFSSNTAQIGEPLTCQARPFREFGRQAFPRGTYLVGQFVAYREPGHFFGKGWMKLEFDRLILPNTDVPVATKVLSVGGFEVEKEGRIHGNGHPTRDALGWVFPPLWPVKLVTLPMRGPRPTLKGEIPVMLRLLDDVSIPREALLLSSTSRETKSDDSNALQRQFSPTLSDDSKDTRSPSIALPSQAFRRTEDRYRRGQASGRIQDRYRQPQP
jgi:hypothetical protein